MRARPDFPARDEFGALGLLVLLAAVFYVAPWAYVYVPAFLAVGILSWRRPDLALALVLVFAPFFMAPKHFGTKEFSPSEIFLLLAVLVVSAHSLVPEKRTSLDMRRITQSPFLPPLLVFVGATTVSLLFAADRHLALRAWREVVIEPAVYFGLSLLLLRRPRQWWLLAVALVGIGVFLGLMALVQLGTHQQLSQLPETSFKRVQAAYGSPDNLGLFYDRVIPLWLAVLVLGRLALRWRLIWLAAGPLLGVVLLFTWSRGAWVATLVGCLLILTVVFRWGRWLAIACLLVMAAAFAVKGVSVVQAFRPGHAHTVEQRVRVWRSSARMVRDHPIVGVGLDNFLHYYAPPLGPAYARWIKCPHGLGYMEPEAWQEPCLSHPHNEILDFWLNSGVLGLAAFIWLEVQFWLLARRGWTQWSSTAEAALVLGASAAMLAVLVHGFVDNSYFLMDLSVVFWFLCAMVSFFAFQLKARAGWPLTAARPSAE